MGKKFSGIFSSRLWDEYDAHACDRTVAFVTDIGNDLAYEEPTEHIMQWVETCVTRLSLTGAEVVLTNVPIGVLQSMSRARFELFRALLFPKCSLPWATLIDRAGELHECLAKYAESQKMPIFTVPNDWYGFDPIHPRGGQLAHYWQALFGLLPTAPASNFAPSNSLRTYWRLRALSTPDMRWKATSKRFLMSRANLADGSRVVLY